MTSPEDAANELDGWVYVYIHNIHICIQNTHLIVKWQLSMTNDVTYYCYTGKSIYFNQYLTHSNIF